MIRRNVLSLSLLASKDYIITQQDFGIQQQDHVTDGWPAHPGPKVLRLVNISADLHTFPSTLHAWLWPGGGTHTHTHTLPTERETLSQLGIEGDSAYSCAAILPKLCSCHYQKPCTTHKLFFMHVTEDPLPVAHPGATLSWNTSRWNIKQQMGSDSLLKAQHSVCVVLLWWWDGCLAGGGRLSILAVSKHATPDKCIRHR